MRVARRRARSCTLCSASCAAFFFAYFLNQDGLPFDEEILNEQEETLFGNAGEISPAPVTFFLIYDVTILIFWRDLTRVVSSRFDSDLVPTVFGVEPYTFTFYIREKKRPAAGPMAV